MNTHRFSVISVPGPGEPGNPSVVHVHCNLDDLLKRVTNELYRHTKRVLEQSHEINMCDAVVQQTRNLLDAKGADDIAIDRVLDELTEDELAALFYLTQGKLLTAVVARGQGMLMAEERIDYVAIRCWLVEETERWLLSEDFEDAVVEAFEAVR